MVYKRTVKDGCFDGMCEVKGKLREFIHSAAQGGRTCTWNNQPVTVEGVIQAIDGRSLYPSSIDRVCTEYEGFPVGPCSIIENWDDKDNFFYYVAKVRILSVNKSQQIPFVSYKAANGRSYTNDLKNEIVVIDKYTLEDWVQFQKIDYEFVEGIYWNQGGNTKLSELVMTLYTARRNTTSRAMNEIYKLCLNSMYGKTMSATPKVKTIIKDKKDVEDFMSKNFERLIDQEDGPNQSIFTIHTDKCEHSNLVHVGCEVLSISKRIMNEVMDLANDNNITIIYQDTDSMHVVDSLKSNPSYCNGVERLTTLYQNKYNKCLLGTGLGQFGIDFKFPGHTNIYSRKSIILGKKAYLDIVCGEKDGLKGETYHARMKGVNTAAMSEYSDYDSLYTNMFNGEIIPFNLTYNNNPMFQFRDQVTTRDDYILNIGFSGKRVIM